MASRNATRDIRTRLIIEGEDEYKAALKSNADEAKELQSEMDLLTAKFEDNADSEDYLAQRTELLARQQENAAERTRIYTEYTESAKDAQERLSAEIDKARATMSSLQAQIEQATSEYGENSEQVQKLTTQYQQYERAVDQMEKQQQKATSTVTRLRTSTNKAEKSQVKFANALKNTDDATENASDGVGSLSDVLSGLGEKLGVDIPQEALTFIDSFSAMDAGVAGAAGGILAAVGLIVKGMQELVEVSKEGAAAASEILQISQNYGIAAETVQQFQYAASLLGLELDELLDAYTSLVSVQGEAASGSEDAAALFQDLGVSVYDTNGKLKDTNTLLFETFEALGQVDDATQRNVLAQQLFGEEAIRLNGIIADGGAQFRAFMEEAKNAGYVLSEDAVRSLDAYDDAMKRSELQTEGFRKQVAAATAEAATGMENAQRATQGFAQSLVALPGQANETVSAMQGVKDFFSSFFGNIGSAFSDLFSGNYIPGHAAGTPYFRGGQTIVGEYGPELVTLPKGSSIRNAADTAAALGGNTVYVTVNANVPDLATLQKIIDFYENYQLTRRKG